MSKTEDDKMLSAETHPYIFRILNDVMAGCEFTITTARALIIVGNDKEETFIDPLSELPADTYLIPSSSVSLNIEMIIINEDPRQLLIRVLGQEVVEEKTVGFNERINIHDFNFAVKEIDDIWSDSVLGVTPVMKLSHTSKAVKYTLACTIALCTALIALIFYTSYDADESMQRRLDRIIVNNNKDYKITRGNDGVFYIFVEDQRASLWVTQSIKRGDFNNPVRIAYPLLESARVGNWISENYPEMRFLRLQLDNPLMPVLMLNVKSPIKNKIDIESLESAARKAMPYARKVTIKLINDAFIINDAKQGLNSLGLSYKSNDSRSETSIVISGELNDTQLQRLQTFITNFYQLWGGDIVKFNVELENNRHKNSSVNYGEYEYFKDGSTRWSFNIK